MNRLPPHNPNVGWHHHGNLKFRMDHPTHLFRHRHSAVIPLFAHAPPTDRGKASTLRNLLPHQTMLPLFLFVNRSDNEDDWVMVEPDQSNASTSVVGAASASARSQAKKD